MRETAAADPEVHSGPEFLDILDTIHWIPQVDTSNGQSLRPDLDEILLSDRILHDPDLIAYNLLLSKVTSVLFVCGGDRVGTEWRPAESTPRQRERLKTICR